MFRYEHMHATIDLKFRVLFDFIMYSSLYLSFAAIAMAYVSSVLQQLPVSPEACLIMFLISFSVYNMNRKTDEKEDEINHSERYAFTKRYTNALLALSFVAYALAFLIAWGFGVTAMAITAVPLLSGILYSVPLLPEGFRFRRMKDIPAVKNLLVGIAWAIPIAMLPAVCTGSLFGTMTIVVGFLFFLLTVINTVIFDMRDVIGDAESGVQTIPVICGVRRTRILLSMLNIGGGSIVLACCTECLSLAEIGVLACIVLYVQCYIVRFDWNAFDKVIYDLVADGQYLLFGGLMYLATTAIV